jgi:hypothetical protein
MLRWKKLLALLIAMVLSFIMMDVYGMTLSSYIVPFKKNIDIYRKKPRCLLSSILSGDSAFIIRNELLKWSIINPATRDGFIDIPNNILNRHSLVNVDKKTLIESLKCQFSTLEYNQNSSIIYFSYIYSYDNFIGSSSLRLKVVFDNQYAVAVSSRLYIEC